MKNIKISKVVFFFSLMIFVTLLVIFILSTASTKEPVVSLREEYQNRIEKENGR